MQLAVKKRVGKSAAKAKSKKSVQTRLNKSSRSKLSKTSSKDVKHKNAHAKKAREKKTARISVKAESVSAKAAHKHAEKKHAENKNDVKKHDVLAMPLEITVKRRIMGEVPTTYHFYLNDGRRLKNLHELIDALDDMSDEVFGFHVNDAKNDFANWVENIIQDDLLAKEMKKAKTKVDTQLRVFKHIVKEITKK